MFAYRSQVSGSVARQFAREVLIQTETLKEGAITVGSAIVVWALLYWAYQIGVRSWMIGALGTFAALGVLATLLHFARYWALASQSRVSKQIRIDDRGLSIATPELEVIRPWHSIRSIRECAGYLLLRVGEKAYVCLPTEEMPAGAREYVIEHVWGALRPPNNALEQTRDG
jgi:hypothetical protein